MRLALHIAALLALGCGQTSECEPAMPVVSAVDNPPGPGCLYLNVDGDRARFTTDLNTCDLGSACLKVAQGESVYVQGSGTAQWLAKSGECSTLPDCH